MLLWKRYVNNKMAAMRFLHLQQYSHRLNLLCFLFVLFVIEYAGNVLFYTDTNTRGKRTDAVFAVCVIYGEKVFLF